MQYNKIPKVIDQFNLFETPYIKNLYFEKAIYHIAVSAEFFYRVHLHTYMDYNHEKIINLNFIKLRALLVRRSCNIPLIKLPDKLF